VPHFTSSIDAFYNFTLNQRQVFDIPPPGVRQIILSNTNISETSITTDDVGRSLKKFLIARSKDIFLFPLFRSLWLILAETNSPITIQSDWISLANARQRMGVCFRLYSRTKRINIRSSSCFLIQENALRRTHSAYQNFETWQSALFLERIREPPVKRIFRLSLELLVKFGALDSIILWSALPHLDFTWLKYRQILVNWFLGTIFGCIEGLN